MKKTINHRFFVRAVALMLTLSFFFTAELSAEEVLGKAMGIRESERGENDFKLSFEPLKSSYKVDDPIFFRIKGNKTFFLYIYSVDREDGSATLLIPGSKQKDNKYERNKTYIVPNKGLEFFSDSPGNEEIVAVASTEYIDLDTAGYKEYGPFSKTTSKEVDQQLKTLRLRFDEKEQKDYILKEMSLRISDPMGASSSPAVSESSGMPDLFISSDRDRYRLGDDITAVYGAGKPGWINLYACEPDGKVSLMKSQKVAGGKKYKLNAQAIHSAGDHAIVALYSETGGADINTESINDLVRKSDRKAFVLTPHSVLRFKITR